MRSLLLVMAGGAVGAGLRYELGRIAVQRLGAGFPWGTLAVNLIGGLMMGLLAGTMMAGGGIERPLWLLLAVGLLGGFTTFSAFSFDMFAMIERGQAGLAAGYALGSVAGALGLLFVGIWIARAVAG
jgi:CrcB protein